MSVKGIPVKQMDLRMYSFRKKMMHHFTQGLVMNVCIHNSLVLSRHKPLSEPMLTKIHATILGITCHNELISSKLVMIHCVWMGHIVFTLGRYIPHTFIPSMYLNQHKTDSCHILTSMKISSTWFSKNNQFQICHSSAILFGPTENLYS